ncbi:MAG: GatB/YqeY domain-containing protein [Pseudomonadota bacterium]
MTKRIETALAEACETGNEVRACTLRLMLAAIRDREAREAQEDRPGTVEGAPLRALLARMIAQREESIRGYEESGHAELAEREREEIEVIRSFLPRPLSAAEMERAVDSAITEINASSIRDLGRVMGLLKDRYPGRIDFCQAGARVKAALG